MNTVLVTSNLFGMSNSSNIHSSAALSSCAHLKELTLIKQEGFSLEDALMEIAGRSQTSLYYNCIMHLSFLKASSVCFIRVIFICVLFSWLHTFFYYIIIHFGILYYSGSRLILCCVLLCLHKISFISKFNITRSLS